MDAINIERMQDAKPFGQRRNSISGIETENKKSTRRPIAESPAGPEQPTSHMSEPFSFVKIKFALPQLPRCLRVPRLRAFAILHIGHLSCCSRHSQRPS